jgi:hypothetical protein
MVYQADYSLDLGPKNTLLTLKAQLVNGSGVNVGSEITQNFTEIGSGNYIWNYSSFPDGFRGGIKILNSADNNLLAFFCVNPEELETISTTAISSIINGILNSLIDESIDLKTIIKRINSFAKGKFVKSGNTLVYYAEDGVTVLYTFTISSTGRD